MKFTAFVATGCLGLGAASSAQAPPLLHLGSPLASPAVEFTRIISAQEIAPGRLLVADEKERKLVAVDFASGASRSVGRIGAGPGEFRGLGAVLPRKGGGAFVVDFVLRRLLPVMPDGSVRDPVPFPAASLLFQSADTAGRLYANTLIFSNRELSDSMRIVRWDPATAATDTLLTFDAGRSGMIIRPGEKRRVWYATTSWAALADGSIALIDAAGYRLRRWSNGTMTPVASLPFTPQPVTAADREAVLAAEKDVRPVAMGQPGARPSAPPPRPEPAFPATFPAFEPDAPLWRAPDGSLWIERLVSPRDSVPLMEIVSAEGKLLARLRLPARSRVISLGTGTVYLVERDENDIERLRQYASPRVPGR